MFESEISVVSLGISITIFIIATSFQFHFFSKNRRKLKTVRDFFSRRQEYELSQETEESLLNPNIAAEGTNLNTLIKELNEYIRKNHGTTDFSIIQNKTERKINVLYEDATSRIAFPTYIGLMGTFIGVFLGLMFFTIGLGAAHGEGITDETIGDLISGVLVSMSTSFIGLLLTTLTHNLATETQKIVSEDKNLFYEFIQNELMPTLGVSMVSALNKLHQTINLFEPSFTRVIDSFQSTFDACTRRFGDAFERNVVTVAEAVRVMGENMDKINQNVDLQAQLLKTMRSRGIVESLDAFVHASQSFELVTTALNRFEVMKNSIQDVTLKLIDTQQNYNKSLELPLTIANKLNQILDRITNFEQSINALGESIENTELLGKTEMYAIRDIITAIKTKQEIAVEAMEVSDGHLKNIFNMQAEAITRLGHTYEESFATYTDRFQNILDSLAKEILSRRQEIVDIIESKFSLENIQREFSQLGKLEKIEELLASINARNSQEDVGRTLNITHDEIKSIHQLLDRALENTSKRTRTPVDKKSREGGFWKIFPPIFSRRKK